MESGAITDEQITSSSQKHKDNAKIVRLHQTGNSWIRYWIADKKDILIRGFSSISELKTLK